MQQQDGILPLFLNLDSSLDKLKPNEGVYIRDLTWDFNANTGQAIGTANPTGEGQNMLSLTPVRSNVAIPNVLLPQGFNKDHGTFYSDNTQETYCFNYNGNHNHGIYILDGNTQVWTTVIIDPELSFSDSQENFIADHRVRLRVVKDKDNNIIEKFLIWTDGQKWQGCISVIASIKTNGFNATLFPYWRLQQPHFDRRELLELPVRPPMVKPEVSVLPNTDADKGNNNLIIDKAFKFAFAFQNTDARNTTLSPWSDPLIVKSEDFINNPDNLPKKGQLVLYAGSPLTEKILLYVKQCGGDWVLYDTIYKFANCGTTPNDVLGTDYWLRTNPWSNYNYDPVFNTIEYVFDFSRLALIVDQTEILKLQTDMPQESIGMTDLGDAIAFAGNRYGYPNFGCDVVDKMDVIVKEKDESVCNTVFRNITLYAYIGRPGDRGSYESQVGFFYGTDTSVRFGGLQMGPGTVAEIDLAETKNFLLNFADKKALRCYLKGTPYYVDGLWYQVNSDNSLIQIKDELDFNSQDTLTYVQNVFLAQGYFACVFKFRVPAGRYNATIGRHNIDSSGDYRNQSTYIMGIANSRVKTSILVTNNNLLLTSIFPNAIVSFSKEQEVDCTNGDVDVWGNNADLFYIFCPYIRHFGGGHWRFVEGYLREDQDDPLPVELFPYSLTEQTGENGQYTDKNGFYFAYANGQHANVADIKFTCKLNCTYPIVFTSPTNQSGGGWRPDNIVYISNHNNGVVGDCNRVLVTGKITNLDGTIGYSNIAISIKDGSTVLTRSDGTFTLIVHNGQNTLRQSNIYINASGNFLITIDNCGQLPLFNFNEANSPCVNCNARNYPFHINIGVNIQTQSQASLKEGGKYSVSCYGGDLAGRIMFSNVIKDVPVSTFMQRDDIKATFLQLLINGANLSAYPDMKWLFVAVSKNTAVSQYFQWVGDNIKYIDNNGNVVSDAATAVFCSIAIDSFYNYNLQRNFTVLSAYQFVQGDRIRILDDGNGNLLDTATYGDEINLQVLGTNYNQAATNAGIIPQNTDVVINPQTVENNKSVTLIVRYDPRLDKLINNNGFWIELLRPIQQTSQLTYCESNSYPVINGVVSKFLGYDVNNKPLYQSLTSIDIDYWDTYFINRNITIPNVGNKPFNHPFESPNISDNWGGDCNSCGRQTIKNENAKQIWKQLNVAKSDNFINGDLINGLSSFDSSNQKDFKEGYSWGGILSAKTQGSIVIFICENNWFITNFNFQFIYANAQGVQIANLDDKLSEPMQKVGGEYGSSFEDTAAIIYYDRFVFFYDAKNEGYIICDYRSAKDITEFNQESGTQGYVKSYFIAKTKFIKNWNNTVSKEKSFDVITGVDEERGNIHVTFRNRKNNSTDLTSFFNNRRNVDLKAGETIVFNIQSGRWTRFAGFVPESYGKIKGDKGIQMIAFASGKPYIHNSGDTFCNFFGQQSLPVITGAINKIADANKVLLSISLNSNPFCFFVDQIFSNVPNSFTYLNLQQFEKKNDIFYAGVLRNMASYPNPDPAKLYQSQLLDGKRTYGLYFLCRLVFDPNNAGNFNELKGVFYLVTNAEAAKK